MKWLSVLCLMFLSFASQASDKKILMMVSEGFNALEYYIPKKIFEERGFEITTATKLKGNTLPDYRQRSSFSPVKGDITFDEINADDFHAIVFAGGNGAWEDFFPNEDVHKALIGFMKQNKLVALLCSSTGLLGLANNLDGKKVPVAAGKRVTGYKRVAGILTQLGKVHYEAGPANEPYVVIDKKLITGRDPESSELFANTVANELSK